jgi:hypothetical protein
MVAQDDLLLTRLLDKIKKPSWVKPKKLHDKASKRLMTGAEAAEQAADKAEQAASRPVQEESDWEDGVVVPGTSPPTAGESQRGTTITLAIRTPERPPDLAPTLASESEDSPESQARSPASTEPARMEGEEGEGPR